MSSRSSVLYLSPPPPTGLIKQFLRDVDWGDVDYMFVDTPPGTSDEHLSLVQYLGSSDVAGAIIVTTPQEVSLMDVRREINFCRKVNLPILGVVENMSQFVCPKCSVSVREGREGGEGGREGGREEGGREGGGREGGRDFVLCVDKKICIQRPPVSKDLDLRDVPMVPVLNLCYFKDHLCTKAAMEWPTCDHN